MAAFSAPGWDELLERVRREGRWCTDRSVEWTLALPSYADLDAAALQPRVALSYEAVLASVALRRRPLPSDPNDRFVETGADRARQGVEASDMASAWRFGQDTLYLRATRLVDDGPHRDQLLREFLELLMSWTDFALLAAAEGHRRTEISRVRQLADEQAALRRVARLVARGVSPTEIFSAVSDEVARVFNSEHTAVARFEGSEAVVVGSCAGIRGPWVGWRVELGEGLLITTIHRTGRPGRRWALPFGPLADYLPHGQPIGTVAAPIVVEGSVWGVVVVWTPEELPSDAEHRLESFTELMATAIANVQARSDLATSRARIVVAADEERRRVVRDLHDGAQQRLVRTVITLKLAQQALQCGAANAP